MVDPNPALQLCESRSVLLGFCFLQAGRPPANPVTGCQEYYNRNLALWNSSGASRFLACMALQLCNNTVEHCMLEAELAARAVSLAAATQLWDRASIKVYSLTYKKLCCPGESPKVGTYNGELGVTGMLDAITGGPHTPRTSGPRPKAPALHSGHRLSP